ncbi:uncharacterized protein LOC103511858 [Diaphorina citri]|uniref:Uncharacterized protein LOC103511858 n=1 Tax=Diaphorina citri TaxID=121845 RepID=A0A1S3D5G8_DIACI|nr:uncharacterized protein LOC103511858 [Diaphorina citri]
MTSALREPGGSDLILIIHWSDKPNQSDSLINQISQTVCNYYSSQHEDNTSELKQLLMLIKTQNNRLLEELIQCQRSYQDLLKSTIIDTQSHIYLIQNLKSSQYTLLQEFVQGGSSDSGSNETPVHTDERLVAWLKLSTLVI